MPKHMEKHVLFIEHNDKFAFSYLCDGKQVFSGCQVKYGADYNQCDCDFGNPLHCHTQKIERVKALTLSAGSPILQAEGGSHTPIKFIINICIYHKLTFNDRIN